MGTDAERSAPMLNNDPPVHTRLRALANRALTPRVAEGLRPRIHAVADESFDAVQGEPRFDLMERFAKPTWNSCPTAA